MADESNPVMDGFNNNTGSNWFKNAKKRLAETFAGVSDTKKPAASPTGSPSPKPSKAEDE